MDMMLVFSSLGVTYAQGVIWLATAAASVLLAYRLLHAVYPGNPKPVSAGEIEDAVLVYTWNEAIWFNRGYLVAWGMLILASLLAS